MTTRQLSLILNKKLNIVNPIHNKPKTIVSQVKKNKYSDLKTKINKSMQGNTCDYFISDLNFETQSEYIYKNFKFGLTKTIQNISYNCLSKPLKNIGNQIEEECIINFNDSDKKEA